MTDVFSFGMLMWRLMAPNEWFRQLESGSRADVEAILREIEAAKQLETFVDLAIHDVRKTEEALRTEPEALGSEALLDCDALCSLLKMSLPVSPGQRSNINDILERLELVVQAEQSDDDSQSERSGTPESPGSRSGFRSMSGSDSGQENSANLPEVDSDNEDLEEGITPCTPADSLFSDKASNRM